MLDPQNFSVYAGDGTHVTMDIDPDDEVTLVGAVIEWCMYAQAMGNPTGEPLVRKHNEDGGTLVVTDPDEQQLEFDLEEDDTLDLDPGNYYHETTIRETDSAPVTVAVGIVTLLSTKNRRTTT